ncbi:MAG: DNA polymerase Y family protein, partial [Pseudomonadota bacterium]
PSNEQTRQNKPVTGKAVAAPRTAPSVGISPVADPPVALVEHGAKGTRITALGPDGYREGLYLDMKLADARSILPSLRVVPHDVSSDEQALDRMAQWLLRYSPSVARYQQDGFLIDTAGCDHLFGGEAAMLIDIKTRLNAMGFTPRLALTDTVGASVALATHGREDVYCLPCGHDVRRLDALPVSALRLDGETITLLNRLGLKTVGAVRAVPRAALERRFRKLKKPKAVKQPSRATIKMIGRTVAGVQWRLDQMAGTVGEPLITIKQPQPFRVTMPCPDLALEHEAVGLALEQLLPSVLALLMKAGQAARSYCLTGFRADGGSSSAAIHLSEPGGDQAQIIRLFKDRLPRIDCGYGIDLFVLEAANCEASTAVQNGMLGVETPRKTAASLAAFADSVNHKTESRAVVKLAPRQSHVPERAQRFVAVHEPVDWTQTCPPDSSSCLPDVPAGSADLARPAWAPRPLRLLQRPEPAEVIAELPDSPPAQFIWRKRARRVLRARGPERILPEWWKDEMAAPGSAGQRDYYDVEDTNGQRYWIFRAIKDHVVEVEDEASIDPDLEDLASLQDLEDLQDLESSPEGSADRTAKAPKKTVRTVAWFVHGLF